ncbi:protein phosphatase 1 regulatory subunit 3E-like [Antedon mediterranea]|uniref:protein phosphatase 1 regulatory subunit 3E-like n=1 Tax=Antedon mediterranea TaxID=105859 RepID=UPI003AF5048A
MVGNGEVMLPNKLENNNNYKKDQGYVAELFNGSSDSSTISPSDKLKDRRSRPGKSSGLRLITDITNGEVLPNTRPDDSMDAVCRQEHPSLSREDDEVDFVLFHVATIENNADDASTSSVTSDAFSPSSLSSCTTPTETDSCGGGRKSALKSPGLRPDTPNRKSVRFADALGLDLETVKHILERESPPDIPEHVFKDLQLASTSSCSTTARRKVLSLTFQQPSGKSDFMHKLWMQNVCLENALISDFMIIGTIKVIDVDYHKVVVVRYTVDNWRTFNEISAGYVYGSHNGPTDRFSFGMSIPRELAEGGSVYFAVRYDVAGKRFWDNNGGKNYSCTCYCDGTDDALGASAWTHFL